MSGRVLFVPHPVDERLPNNSGRHCDWPGATEAHARKFLESRGSWLTALNGGEQRGQLRVWCEYEAPTIATRIPLMSPEHPAWLHEIDAPALHAISSARMASRHLNTDPWIWDTGFVWSVCKHFTSGKLRADVASIAAGDIVLFGSSRGGRWMLDTVLVAAGPPIPYRPGVSRSPTLSLAYRDCVSEPLSGCSLRIVLGAHHAGNEDPFSFAPAIPAATGASFARIDISSVVRRILLKNRQPAKPSNGRAFAAGVYPGGNLRLWRDLVSMTLRAGQVLGISFDHPYKGATQATVHMTSLHGDGCAVGRERVDGTDTQHGVAPDGLLAPCAAVRRACGADGRR